MFSDALSTSLLRLCDEENLSYAAAAERVGCSTEFWGRIIRRQSSPTIPHFERICHGFERTPNQLLGIIDSKEATLYRIPMKVDKIRVVPAAQLASPVCPQCKCSLEREFQAYCDRCGQSLRRNEFHKAESIIIFHSQAQDKERKS